MNKMARSLREWFHKFNCWVVTPTARPTPIRMLMIMLSGACLFLTACSPRAPACPQASVAAHHLMVSPEALPTPAPVQASTPIPMKIGGKTILVDKVVEGPLCNDIWGGTVYVTCNVQVYPWEEAPTFLKGCNLTIEPGTVVYVAAHNNTAYYNGCSCHTGEVRKP